jgi:hypothetical protein
VGIIQGVDGAAPQDEVDARKTRKKKKEKRKKKNKSENRETKYEIRDVAR